MNKKTDIEPFQIRQRKIADQDQIRVSSTVTRIIYLLIFQIFIYLLLQPFEGLNKTEMLN